MFKVNILVPCSYCQGQAYLPYGEATDGNGRTYIRHVPCPICEGTGNAPKWVTLEEFAKLVRQATCTHQHTSFSGGQHFSGGDIWDDIQEVCNDCGAKLEGQTVADLID